MTLRESAEWLKSDMKEHMDVKLEVSLEWLSLGGKVEEARGGWGELEILQLLL